MSYYDRNADRWDAATGSQGGAFKQLVLNDRMLALIGDVSDRDVLEVGAGNGYFARLLWRRHSGREPSRLIVTDLSVRLIELARRRYGIRRADYMPLDVRRPFPFPDASFDRVVAIMVFNELDHRALQQALRESARVLRNGGRLVGATLHPRFVESLSRRGALKEGRPTTMPGPEGLRLPVVVRSLQTYRELFAESGFEMTFADVEATPEVLSAKPGLRHAGKGMPLALVFAGHCPGRMRIP